MKKCWNQDRDSKGEFHKVTVTLLFHRCWWRKFGDKSWWQFILEFWFEILSFEIIICHQHSKIVTITKTCITVILAPIRLPPLGPARLITRRESLNPLLLRRRASRRESLGKDKNHFYVLIEWYPYILTKIVIMDSLPPPDSNKIQFFIVGSSILRRTKVSRLYTVLYCRRDSFKRLSKP